MEWTELLDRDGVVLQYVEGERDGLPLADLAEVAPRRSIDDAVAVAVSRIPGWTLATGNLALATALLAAGAKQIRHAFVMSADTSLHHDAPAVETMPRAGINPREFLAGWQAAYPPGHPDHEEGDDEELITRDWDWYHAPVGLAREHRSTGLVVHDGTVVAGIIVGIRPQPAPFGGPWVHDIWRVPGVSQPGIGAALIAQAMRLLHEDGQPVLGLTVSDGNPARRVYERLGFQPVLESWTLRLPPKGHEAL